MHIALVMPENKRKSYLDGRWIMKHTKGLKGNMLPPASLMTIAALTPEEIRVTIIDENVESIDFDTAVDLVAISAYTSAAPRAYEIADNFRKRGVTVVMGGIHASMLPEEAISHADSVVIGEAEGVWSEVLADHKNNLLKRFYKGGYPEISNAPPLRRDLIKRNRYLVETIQTTRGCPFNCKFCTVHKFNGRRPRHRNIKNVVDEIRDIYAYSELDNEGRLIFFLDDNFYGDPRYAKELCRELIDLRRIIDFAAWGTQISFNVHHDEEMLDLLFKSGCRWLYIGFESLCEDNIFAYGKKQNNTREYFECIEKIRSFGMDVMGSFIIGNDFDDAKTIDCLKTFIQKSNLIFPDVSILTPYPGCDLYAEMESCQQLLHKQWDKYDNQHVVFQPKKMTPAELEQAYAQLLHEVFSAEVMSKKLEYLQGAVSRKQETHGFALLLPSYRIKMILSLGLKSQNTKEKPGRFGLFDRLLAVIAIMSLLPYLRSKTKITAFSLIRRVVLSKKMNAFDVIYLLLIFDMDNFLRGVKGISGTGNLTHRTEAVKEVIEY